MVSAGCCVRERDDERVLVLRGLPVFCWSAGDTAPERLVAAQMLELGHANAAELSAAFELSVRTLFRLRQVYVEDGAEAVVPKKRGPKGARLGEVREASIRRWHGQAVSNVEMARRLGVSEGTVRNALKRMGLRSRRSKRKLTQGNLLDGALASEPPVADDAREPEPVKDDAREPEPVDNDTAEAVAPGPQASSTEVAAAHPGSPRSLDTDPDNRVIDRFLAHEGELDDAVPLFKDRTGLSRVGVLLAVPLIVDSGVLEAARKTYGHIGPAFFGLRSSLMTLLFMALLRIKNPENLKRYNPAELGWLLGLDRAPEMKTLRRKLLRLGDEPRRTEIFLRELLQRRAAARDQALGFLYVDGHVRAYSGKTKLPKTHVARMRISMPATQEVWVNDAEGGPLFFVTQEAHGQLVSELPAVLKQVREVVGPERRVTVVFDRGGWSPRLFAKMDATGFDVLTYRKGKVEPIDDELFATSKVPGSDGKEHYELADTEVEVGPKGFGMRQVTRRTLNRKGEAHQTHIVTTRRDLPAPQVAHRMFARWQQENFFKYMRQEFAIDALLQYATEPADTERLVPNPERKAVDKELASARRDLSRLQTEYGTAAIDNPESKRPTMRGFKIAHGTDIGIPLRRARQHVDDLQQRRASLPTHVPVGTVQDPVLRLAPSRKRLHDGVKMLAYQIETDLVTLVTQHYRRTADDGRPLIAAALQSRGDITIHPGEIRVTLAAQSSPHRTRAIAKLCAELDATRTCFPGTKLGAALLRRRHGDAQPVDTQRVAPWLPGEVRASGGVESGSIHHKAQRFDDAHARLLIGDRVEQRPRVAGLRDMVPPDFIRRPVGSLQATRRRTTSWKHYRHASSQNICTPHRISEVEIESVAVMPC